MSQNVIFTLVILFSSIVLHELGHAWVALQFGDPTAKFAGRITLNPLAHVDLFGTVILPLMCILSGAPVFGWAKPVPVNFARLRPRNLGIIAVALAGVTANMILAVTSAMLLRFLHLPHTSLLSNFLGGMVLINVALFVFNLVPIPPLDGSRILNLFLPDDVARFLERNQIYCLLALVLILPYLPIFPLAMTISKILIGA